MSFDIWNQLNKRGRMLKEKRKKNAQKSDCWDRISEIADRDIPYHLNDQADIECENPWVGPVDSYEGKGDI